MPVVILVDSFEPAHVIVSVSYPVDIDHPGDRGGTRVSAAYSEAAHCELSHQIIIISVMISIEREKRRPFLYTSFGEKI